MQARFAALMTRSTVPSAIFLFATLHRRTIRCTVLNLPSKRIRSKAARATSACKKSQPVFIGGLLPAPNPIRDKEMSSCRPATRCACSRVAPRIGVPGNKHHRGIGNAVGDVLIWRIGAEGIKVVSDVGATEFLNPVLCRIKQMVTKHIEKRPQAKYRSE